MKDDGLDKLLANLPERDLAEARATRLGIRARRAFLRAADDAAHPTRALWTALWDGALEPGLASGAVLIYLGWALTATATLLGAS